MRVISGKWVRAPESVPFFPSAKLALCSVPSDDLTLDRCSLAIILVDNREEGGKKKDLNQYLTD